MNNGYKTIAIALDAFHKLQLEDIIAITKTQEDREEALKLICKYQLYPIDKYINLPEEIDHFVNGRFGIYYDRYMTVSYSSLLEDIAIYLSEEFKKDKKNRGTGSAQLIDEWYDLSEKEIYSECVNLLYKHAIDNKISGCIFDW